MSERAERAREAIKTGLAMAIVFGIALSQDWVNPMWAGFSVAMISLTTAGQSLNKGALRLLGTVVGVATGLGLIALFPQARVGMLLGLTLWVGVCTYMLTGSQRQYFWFVSGFVALIVFVDSGGTSLDAFNMAVERAQETGLGVGVYTLVSVLLWPKRSAPQLQASVAALATTQRKIFETTLSEMLGRTGSEDSRALRMQGDQLVAQLGPALGAAAADTYKVWEVRGLWRELASLSGRTMQALERLRLSLPEVDGRALRALLPGLEDFCAEIRSRLERVERSWTEPGEPLAEPGSVDLAIDGPAVHALSTFSAAALAVTRRELLELDQISRSLLDSVREIQSGTRAPAAAARGRSRGLAIDLDRVTATLRVLATLWLSYLLWIYVNPPGHISLVQLATTLAMAVAMMPTVSPLTLFVPFGLGCLLGGGLHVLVMPQLSGFSELGVMLFFATAGVYYVFGAPQQALAKMGAIIPVIVLTGIHNEQSYSFAGVANSSLMIGLGISLATVAAYLPPSPRPEKVFVRLLRRFFRHAEYTLSRFALDRREGGIAERLRAALYRSDLLELPHKLAAWGRAIDARTSPDASAEGIAALVASTTSVAHRIHALEQARREPQADLLVEQLLADVRAWRQAVQEIFHRWAGDPGADPGGNLAERLANRLEQLEQRTSETFARQEAGALERADYERFYRLLGGYRGVSEAVIAHAELATRTDWPRWREARF